MKAFKEFLTTSGKSILVGQNARDNNYLTFKTAFEHDLFFHASDFSGSHVILRLKEAEIPSTKDIREAATLAAYFSKGKTRATVKVDYVLKKYVSRHRKDPPGLVELEKFKTLKIKNPQVEFVKIKRL